MAGVEKTVNIAASVCSLFAFIILIYEKSGYFELSMVKIIAYIVFCISSIFFTSLSIFFIQKYNTFVQKKVENIYLKVCTYMILLFSLISYYVFTIYFVWDIISTIN